ncbi:site-2 protease family protein [Roseomonas elaeocarpi]|uniref:Site-2 protease family protein n=1 Tax=Roseomonas elaeocarpi TaxID=907779 RepID=A0ABV6K1B1_9PROT
MPDWLPEFLAAAIAAILAITLHEAAHGFAALWLGDDTARRAGRLSINPLRHVDLVGTILVPGFLVVSQLLTIGTIQVMFGWAKPVPVDIRRLNNPRFGMVGVAAAGPLVNVLLAFVAALFGHVADDLSMPPDLAQWVYRFLSLLILSNLVLGLFNLIPIPPMDGGRILGGLLPPRVGIPFLRLERAGLLLVMLVLFVLPQLVPAWAPMDWLLRFAVQPAFGIIMRAAGYA